jgi:hypothetical protein
MLGEMLEKYLDRIVHSEEIPPVLTKFSIGKVLPVNKGDIIKITNYGEARMYKILEIDGDTYSVEKLPNQEPVFEITYD